MCKYKQQEGWDTVESWHKIWSTGEGDGKPLQYSCLQNPMNSMKREKDVTLKDELSMLEDTHMLLEKSREIAPERKKRQSDNNIQLWM